MNSAAVFFCKILSFLLAGLFSIGLPVKIHGRPLSGSITVTAHSGCLDLPDNSVEAMKAGVEAGARIFEFALNFTADGTPVLSHEALDEDGEYVTLEEAFAFLAEHPGILANVDVKNNGHIEAVPSLAEKAGILDRIFFTGIEERLVTQRTIDDVYQTDTIISRSVISALLTACCKRHDQKQRKQNR